MKAITRWIVLGSLLSRMGVAAAAEVDPYEDPKALNTAAFFAQCPNSGGAEASVCLKGVVKTLRARMKTEITHRLAEIAAVATQKPGPGVLAGPATAQRWRRDFLAGQAAWDAYDGRECRNVSDYDYFGGSAAGQFAAACEIRHLVARINEVL